MYVLVAVIISGAFILTTFVISTVIARSERDGFIQMSRSRDHRSFFSHRLHLLESDLTAVLTILDCVVHNRSDFKLNLPAQVTQKVFTFF